MRCDIIIPVWNNLEFTRDCVGHLVRNTNYPYRLILVDNGSDYPTKAYLEGLKGDRSLDVILIRNEENLGFVKAANQGLRASSGPYVCVMNNDTLPAPGWLERMVEFAEGHKDIGLMNPVCDGNPGMSLDEHAEAAQKDKGGYLEVNQCFLFATLIKREVIDRIGYLDEAFGTGCFEDADYAMRAKMAGYRCARVDSSYVHHTHGVTFKAIGTRAMCVARGEEEYFKRWPRPLRIGAGLSLTAATSDTEIKNMLDGLLYLAREWCWINFWVLGRRDENRIRISGVSRAMDMPLHQNIKFNFISRLEKIKLLTRILERSFGTKRCKRYDAIIVNDGNIRSFLMAFYPVHKARVVLLDLKSDIIGALKNL